MHKRKAVESSQTAADLKLHLDKYQAQLKEAQVSVAEKTGALEQESFKYKRMQVSCNTIVVIFVVVNFLDGDECSHSNINACIFKSTCIFGMCIKC